MYYYGTPGQGDLPGVDPSWDCVDPPCAYGKPCECELCTCKYCSTKLVWVESLKNTVCPICDEDVLLAEALKTIDSVYDPRGTVMMYTNAFDCRAVDEWWQIQTRSHGGRYEWRDLSERELLGVSEQIQRSVC